jgi:hypothetical protein
MGVSRKTARVVNSKISKEYRRAAKEVNRKQPGESLGKLPGESNGKMISQEYLWGNNKNYEKDSKGKSTREQRGKSWIRVR